MCWERNLQKKKREETIIKTHYYMEPISYNNSIVSFVKLSYKQITFCQYRITVISHHWEPIGLSLSLSPFVLSSLLSTIISPFFNVVYCNCVHVVYVNWNIYAFCIVQRLNNNSTTTNQKVWQIHRKKREKNEEEKQKYVKTGKLFSILRAIPCCLPEYFMRKI